MSRGQRSLVTDQNTGQRLHDSSYWSKTTQIGMQAANSRIFHLFLTLHQLGVCICLSVCVCECVRVFLLVCRQFVHVWVLKKAGGGVWGEMNLGKMGIQICEKLRENLGWRQIGSCHKWDSKAGYWSIRGPELHAYSAQSVNQDWEPFPDWDRNSKKKIDNWDQTFLNWWMMLKAFLLFILTCFPTENLTYQHK